LQFAICHNSVFFHHFDNNRQINTYAGIDISRYQSGKTLLQGQD
jgi:transposase